MSGVDEAYKRLALMVFGGVADLTMENFRPIKPHLVMANIKVLLKTWIAIIFFTSLLVLIGSFVAIVVIFLVFGLPLLEMIYIVAFVPFIAASVTFVFFYLYPIQKSKSLEREIDNDLPFALAHMSAIASSGIPPEFMFELLTGFKEYGPISQEAEVIVRNINTFGMSSVTAIGNVAAKTPSSTFRETLSGIVSTIEKGGNLSSYLNQMSEKSLFDYRIKREKYLKTLGIYADIYTALLVAAPLMMLSVLGVMGIIGGDVLGLTVQDIIYLVTWFALPVMNIVFLAFIHITYPGV